jgi:hypothetical protein
MESKPMYRRTLFVVPVVALLCAGVWLAFFRDSTPTLTTDGAKEKAAAFLDEVRAGRVDDAWAATSADFKSMYGRDRFRQYVKSKPILKTPAEFDTCEFKTDSELRTAECLFRPAGGKGAIKVVLNVDQGAWKVGRLSVE